MIIAWIKYRLALIFGGLIYFVIACMASLLLLIIMLITLPWVVKAHRFTQSEHYENMNDAAEEGSSADALGIVWLTLPLFPLQILSAIWEGFLSLPQFLRKSSVV